jgi:hypothetical protein
MSLGELFRVATGTSTFTVYLKDRDGYAPVWAVEEDTLVPQNRWFQSRGTIESMITGNAARERRVTLKEATPAPGAMSSACRPRTSAPSR